MRIFRKGKYEVGEKWKFVASHTARRSFATNLAELDVPLVQIAKRMGHNDVKMTMRYIVGTISRLEDKANEFLCNNKTCSVYEKVYLKNMPSLLMQYFALSR